MNWIAAYNTLFRIIDRTNTPTYLSGPNFLKLAQHVDVSIPSYNQLISIRQSRGLSTSRKDYYWDILQSMNEQQRFRFYRTLIEALEPHAKDELDQLRNIVFGGVSAVPTTVVPVELWNSQKLNLSLREIDNAIDALQYNRATTLTYTCLEGLYKAYIRKHIPDQSQLSELMPLCKAVKDDISFKLKAQGPFPEQIVNAIPTLTNAVANSRNGFSESHFAGDAQKWLALFTRDMTNSIGRLLLHFI
ncbi:hypothetical protein [Pseudomonas oryzihabitans]|uniref:hypothetical protein n=1 Tax=Pseudomonas oryzihabitans TaxID=47885 RepID=UPI0028678612|nr:hypothetical protein [Pseudomonas psychrotolerans]MDR6679513.1 hypothetical protein [Pseudomonas psychrotolerans]